MAWVAFSWVWLDALGHVTTSPSSSGRYLLSMASLIWLLAPLGSRSIAQLKFISARWVWPSFLYTLELRGQRSGGPRH